MFCRTAPQTPTYHLRMLVSALAALVAAVVGEEVSANGFRFGTSTLGKGSDGNVCVLLLSLLRLILMGSCSKFNLYHVKSTKEVVIRAKNLDVGLSIDLADFSGKRCVTCNKRRDERTQRGKKFQWLGVASKIAHYSDDLLSPRP